MDHAPSTGRHAAAVSSRNGFLRLQRFGAFVVRSGIFVPVLFLGLALMTAPHLDPRDWDYDEGINLMKAMLLRRGFALYADIWSDQPPLLTALLSGWASLFGETVASARLLIILFAALLLWALYLAMRNRVSTTAAGVALLLLLVSEYFLRLSGAVMVGLPSLALATVAAALLVVGSPGRPRIAVAALVLAAALQVKLIVGLIVPALTLHLLFGRKPDESVARLTLSVRLVDLFLFGAVGAAGFILIALPFNALQPGQLLGTHFGAETWQQALFVAERSEFLPNFLRLHWAYLLTAAIGVGWLGWMRDRALILPLTWFLTTLAALSIHRPLWYHHVLLLTVPLCWLAAFGVERWIAAFNGLEADEDPGARKRRVAFLVGSALFLALAVTMTPSSLEHRLEDQMSVNRPNYIPHIAERFSTDAAQSPGWVFTDHPFYAYQAGLPVPPPIAAISRKRLETGIITQEQLVNVLYEYTPRYVILERFTYSYSPPFMALLEERYDLVVEIEPARYYRLKAGYDAGVPPR